MKRLQIAESEAMYRLQQRSWQTRKLLGEVAGEVIFIGEHPTLRTRPPTEHDRRLVHHALAMFTPWGSPHVPSPAPSLSMLETHFGWASARSDWERIHALIDPVSAGLPQLIREYNHHFPRGSDLCLEDPDQKLAIPCFDP